MHIAINDLSAELFLSLYGSVGWESPCKAQVETALAHTLATFTAYERNTPLGMVRLLGDGGMSFYVKDFAVVPTAQGRGVGKALLNAVEEYILAHIDPGWAVSLELISSQEAVVFYQHHGFDLRPNDWDGPGMFKMLQREKKS